MKQRLGSKVTMSEAVERTESPRQDGKQGKTLQDMSGEEREEAIKKKAEGVPFLHQLVDEGEKS